MALNSNIIHVAPGRRRSSGCAPTSRPTPSRARFAYWHHPRFTSGSNHAPDLDRAAVPGAVRLQRRRRRLGPQPPVRTVRPDEPQRRLDNARGLRAFVVGTGGAGHYSFGTIQPNSEARNSDTFGVLKFTLHANSYDWQFVPEAGKTYTDSGTGTCH